MEKRNSNIKLIILILLLVPLSQLAIDIYLPSFPAMKARFHTHHDFIQWSLSIFMLGAAISQLLLGVLSDFYGRRKILFSGIILYLIATLICTTANSTFTLLVGRFLQGLGIGSCSVVANAITGDSFTGVTLAKVSSYGSCIYSLTPLIAPFIGGFIQYYLGWRANFIFLFLFTLPILIIEYIWLPETKARNLMPVINIRCIFLKSLKILKNLQFISYVLLMTFAFGLMITFNVIGPFLLQESIHLSSKEYGEIVLLIGFAYLLGTLFNSRLLDLFKPDLLIFFGIVFMLIGGVFMLIFAEFSILNLSVVITPLMLTIFGTGLVFPNCLAKTLSLYPEMTGTVSAMLGFIIFIGCTILSGFVALFNDHSQTPLAICIVVLSFWSFILLILTTTNKSRFSF